MKPTIALFFLIPWISFSCNFKQQPEIENSTVNTPAQNGVDFIPDSLTIEQENALDILDQIQISTDDPNTFYSTFSGLDHAFLPADTILTLKRVEFQKALRTYLETRASTFSSVAKDSLAEMAAAAQEEYIVLVVGEGSPKAVEGWNSNNNIWLIPSLLDHRDVVIHW